ncbi:MAG: TolC family protein, partial [Rhodoferax sp.]|nr:TolC family protein [Rhodoferax sp.]
VPQLDRTSAAMAAESIATDRRPDVLAARPRLLAAELARDLARAQRVRDVGVGVQLDHWPVSASNASGTGNTVSVSVSLPLFVRHGLEGELARSEADVANARETLRRAQLTAQSELAQARSRWAAAAARWRLATDELAPAAERVAAGAELAYRRGATSLLDVLDARRSLRTARIERINAEADGAKAAAEMAAARFELPD